MVEAARYALPNFAFVVCHVETLAESWLVHKIHLMFNMSGMAKLPWHVRSMEVLAPMPQNSWSSVMGLSPSITGALEVKNFHMTLPSRRTR